MTSQRSPEDYLASENVPSYSRSATSSNNNNGIPPPPLSSAVPSPTGGIHTIDREGVGHNILPPSHSHFDNSRVQLRHRQPSISPSYTSRAITSSNISSPAVGHGMRTTHDLLSESLQQSPDDADAAAGSRRAVTSSLAFSPDTRSRRAAKKNAHREKSHSFSSYPVGARPAKISPTGSCSRSVGSKTPETHAFHKVLGLGGSSVHSQNGEYYYDAARHSTGSYDTRGGRMNAYQRHTVDFFREETTSSSSPTTGQTRPPQAHRMDRGAEHHRKGLRAAFGNSEHDFLLLTSRDDESSESSYSSGGTRRRRYNLKRIPPLPPVEIVTNNNVSVTPAGSPMKQSGNGARASPPYGLPSGLPTITGSPSVTMDEERKLLLRTSPNMKDADTISKPPLIEPPANDGATNFTVLGWDLSNYSRRNQFVISASGTFGFSLLYGYLQELISVELCNRKLGLFLAVTQFTGYTFLSYFFRKLEKGRGGEGGTTSMPGSSSSSKSMSLSRKLRRLRNWGRLRRSTSSSESSPTDSGNLTKQLQLNGNTKTVPLQLYVGLSVIRAIDLGMTNLAMQYVNYPAKTLMKSTRVVFTMIFGVFFLKKRYGVADYGIVGLMVAGLGMFMHADAHSSAVFQPLGIVMLTISLLCDGAVSNLSEALMNKYEVGQDEFIFRLYSVATFFILIAAGVKGDLRHGMAYLTYPGTLKEMEEDLDPTWSVSGKIVTMALFSATGFFGSSCAAAITKSFGALTMSITSTARKATTIFLSFALFPNECTMEHIGGIFLFIASLVAKSLRASQRGRHHHHHHNGHKKKSEVVPLIEMSNGSSMDVPNGLRRNRLGSGEDAV